MEWKLTGGDLRQCEGQEWTLVLPYGVAQLMKNKHWHLKYLHGTKGFLFEDTFQDVVKKAEAAILKITKQAAAQLQETLLLLTQPEKLADVAINSLKEGDLLSIYGLNKVVFDGRRQEDLLFTAPETGKHLAFTRKEVTKYLLSTGVNYNYLAAAAEKQRLENEEYPEIYMDIPDGRRLKATLKGVDGDYPGIQIELLAKGKPDDIICWAEYNTGRNDLGDNQRLRTLVWNKKQDEPAFNMGYDTGDIEIDQNVWTEEPIPEVTIMGNELEFMPDEWWAEEKDDKGRYLSVAVCPNFTAYEKFGIPETHPDDCLQMCAHYYVDINALEMYVWIDGPGMAKPRNIDFSMSQESVHSIIQALQMASLRFYKMPLDTYYLAASAETKEATLLYGNEHIVEVCERCENGCSGWQYTIYNLNGEVIAEGGATESILLDALKSIEKWHDLTAPVSAIPTNKRKHRNY